MNLDPFVPTGKSRRVLASSWLGSSIAFRFPEHDEV
jgi:hypothetical protein